MQFCIKEKKENQGMSVGIMCCEVEIRANI
jgi:hypothetical protein